VNSKSLLEEPGAEAIFGVAVLNDGSIQSILHGSYDAGQADEIARQLVLIAASIRSTARQRLIDAGK